VKIELVDICPLINQTQGDINTILKQQSYASEC